MGLQISNNLSWNDYVLNNENSLVKSLSRRINCLTKVCSGADFKSRKMIATGLVMLRLTYRIQVYGQANDYLIQILQTQQNRAARFVANSALGTRTSAVLK